MLRDPELFEAEGVPGIILVKGISIFGKEVESAIKYDPTTDFLDRLLAWFNGNGLITDMLPELSKNDREFLISGLSPSAWDDLFGSSDGE